MNLNRAMIIGNVTRDPEAKTTTTGKNVTNFGVATNHSWTDASGQKQDKAEFHNIVAWGKLGEICSQFLGKGRKVFIEGRIETREWDAQDGTKRNRTEIVAENMIMLDRSPAGSAGPATFDRNKVASTTSNYAANEPVRVPDAPQNNEEIRVEDIPF